MTGFAGMHNFDQLFWFTQDRIYENTRVLKNMKKEDAKLSGKKPKNSPSIQKTERDLQKELEKLNNLKKKTSKANGKPKGRK